MRCWLIFIAFLAPGRSCLLGTEAGAEDRGEADSLFECRVFGIHQICQKKKILCCSDGMAFCTFGDFMLLHPKQISNQRVFFRLKRREK